MNTYSIVKARKVGEDWQIVMFQILFFLCLVAAWEYTVRAEHVSRLALASPLEIGRELVKQYPLYVTHLKVTLLEIGIGFICGAILATVLAVIIVHSQFLSRLMYPYIVALNSTAKVAIAPLILLLFGHGLLPVIAIVVLISFLPLMNNLVIGLKSVDPDLLEVLAIYKASQWQVFKKARLPAALPYLFSGLRTAAVFSVKGAVIGEVFQSTDKGLGFLITQGDFFFDVALVYGASLITCTIGISFFFLITLMERRLLYWHESRIGIWSK